MDLENYIRFVSNFQPALQFTHTISFLDIRLRITDDHISTTIYYKDTDTHTYLHHQSSHSSHCKKGLPRSQLLRLRRLCSEDSDFLEKGGEMVSFFEQRGYSPDCLQNDLQAIRRLDRAGVLNNHNPSNQRSEMIPLFLTYHPFNERIKRILLYNFNILSSDPETREQSFRSHRWSSIAVTATSVISSYILRIAANPVFRRVHLRTYTLTAALAITFLATLVSVALKTLLSSRRRFLAKRLAWSTASPVSVALLSISAKQGVLQDNVLANTFGALKRTCRGFLWLNISTRLVTQSTTLWFEELCSL